MIDHGRSVMGRAARVRLVGRILFFVGIGSLAGCDVDLGKIIGEVTKGPTAPGNSGGGSAPVPPPSADAGVVTPPGPPPAPPPSPPILGCDDWTGAGDETTCRTVSEWKLFAYEACLAKEMNLNDYSAGGGDCGVGSTRMVKYQCCTPAPQPPPNPDPPPGPTPPPNPGVCTGASEGGETSCKSTDMWKTYAIDNCERQGMTLTDIGYGTDCGGGNYRYMKYVCCATASPAPAPPK